MKRRAQPIEDARRLVSAGPYRGNAGEDVDAGPTRGEGADVCGEVEEGARHRLHHRQPREELFLGYPGIRPGHLGVARAHGRVGGREHERAVVQRADVVVRIPGSFTRTSAFTCA